MTIVTCTYRYKPPPKRRKPVAIPQRIVTAKESRHPGRLRGGRQAAAEVDQAARRRAGDAQPSTPFGKSSMSANDDTPRRSAIITVLARKTVHCQREQQPMTRIVTYTPKRQRDAWTKYLRLIGQQPEEPPMQPSPP